MSFTPRDPNTIRTALLANMPTKPSNPSAADVIYNLFTAFAIEASNFEAQFTRFETDLETLGTSLVAGTERWYAAQSLLFQYGDSLTIDGDGIYYSVIDETKRIIKVSSATSVNGVINIKVAKLDNNNLPVKLSAGEKTAFQGYWDIKIPAGDAITVISQDGDEIKVYASVKINGTVINSTGESITTAGTYPVEEAILNYCKGLDFNGEFKASKLVDAIQSVQGVNNVVITSVLITPNGGVEYDLLALTFQSAKAVAGYLVEHGTTKLRTTITYTIGE